jgi:NTE family protein
MDAGYRVKAIAGTSAGGVVGAIIASGSPRGQILELLSSLVKPNFFSRRDQDGPSLLGLSGLVKTLTPLLDDLSFQELKIPLALTAVDIRTKQEIILNHGSVMDAVVATSSIPGVFPPVKIGSYELVDGGVLDPVPVAVARWLAPKLPVVAVCLNPEPEHWKETPNISVPFDTRIPKPIISRIANMRLGQAVRIYVDSMDISGRMITELRLQVEKPEVIIRPNLTKYGYLDPGDPLELMDLGKQALEKALPDLQESLSWRHKIGRQFQNPQPPSKVLED